MSFEEFVRALPGLGLGSGSALGIWGFWGLRFQEFEGFKILVSGLWSGLSQDPLGGLVRDSQMPFRVEG